MHKVESNKLFQHCEAEQRSLQIIAALLIDSNPLNKETRIMAFNLKITTAYKKGINNVSSVTTKINV